MVFSSFLFLFGFLPLCLISYFFTPKRLKNFMLLIWSLIFYAWGTFSFFPIFILGCIIDFFIAHQIIEGKKYRKIFLGFSIFVNLTILFYFKYFNFFMTELNNVLVSFNLQPSTWQHVILPIGISFITFQRISYVVDVYRGNAIPTKNIIDYILYIALFPQLIAGPIVRYHDIAEQLRNRLTTLDDIWAGANRFCVGLGKKVLIADALGNVTSNVDHLNSLTMTAGYAWLGVICYGLQLYFDFSGYSDMAIGLGRIFGFKFLENFNYPFISQTFTEFWRRWHISLSRVMCDYLYIPLGGNRVKPARAVLNLWIVFLASGIWHGANWTYITFGAYHGLFLTIDKLGWKKFTDKFANYSRIGKYINITITLFFLQFGWVLFKSRSIEEAWRYLGYMFNFSKPATFTIPSNVIHNEAYVILLIAIFFTIFPLFIPHWKEHLKILPQPLSNFVFCAIIIILCATVLSATRFTPFIYFQF